MIRLLIITAVSGLVLCVACLSGAFALGGREIWTKGFDFASWDFRIDGDEGNFKITPAQPGRGGVFIDGERMEESDGGSYASWWNGGEQTREFVWAGAGEIDIGLPADITYTQGPSPKITVTGPAATLDRFYVEDGDLRLRGWSSSNTFTGIPNAAEISGARPPRLKVNVTAPGVTKFELSGTETLEILNYNQDNLTIDNSGASKVTVSGSTRVAILDLSGAASADLAALSIEQLNAELSGASRATVAPKAAANLEVSGASRLTLLSKPPVLVQKITGAASVESGSSSTSPDPASSASTPKAK